MVALPWQAELDLTAAVADQRNILLMGEGGGIIFQHLEPGVYEAHTQFLPGHRGAKALRETRDAIHWMFMRSDAMELLTKVPEFNKPADVWSQLAGGTLEFERPNCWPTADGMCGCKFYALRYPEWVRKQSRLDAVGHWFHEKLEAAKITMGASSPIHDDDPAHDRYVGAAVEMIASGQVAKGVVLYNRWAKFAGYGLITVLSADPVVIDIGDAVLQPSGQDFEVLLCR